MSLGLLYQSRLAKHCALTGETLTFSTAGARTGVVSVATAEQVAENFDPTTAAGLTYPVIALVLDGAQTAPGAVETATRDGRTLTVKKSDYLHVAGVVVARLVLLA